MSAGTPRKIVRIDAETWDLVKKTIAHRNAHVDAAPWTESDFLRIAVQEKVQKMDRSRGRRLAIGDEPADLDVLGLLSSEQKNLFDTVESGEASA